MHATKDRNTARRLIAGVSLAALMAPVGALAEPEGEFTVADFAAPFSPYANKEDQPNQLLFGDMHLHTNLSPDAGLLGTQLTAEDSYRAARGETVTSNTGQPFRLVRPLDFLVITDHAELIGLAPLIRSADPDLKANPFGAWLVDRFSAGPEGAMEGFAAILDYAARGEDPIGELPSAWAIWRDFVATADRFNDPGTFTAMTGFEWTSQPGGDNLHRIVVLADGADKTSQVMPFSLLDSQDPADLWTWMENYEAKTGGQVFAHVHNGNLSNGLMFNEKQFDGTPMDAAYAARRLRWEPIAEITQIKGDGETHPKLSPDDEFADFERWDKGNLTGSAGKEDWMLKYEYGRSALKTGLEMEAKIGVNPYAFGFNAASDSHTGLPSTGEENYFGKFAGAEPRPDRFDKEVIPAADPANRIISAQESASGLTGVWAKDNSRQEIFDALMRKEVYATTGTRLRVRLFAGWDFAPGDETAHDFANIGYQRGVPMGGRLFTPPDGAAPSFIIQAMRDPDWANLDRIQIIKGWVGADGVAQERIYDVTVSGDRKIGEDGRAHDPVGSTVDLKTATFSNSIGAPMLSGYWKDPDFHPDQRAFYYVRVLEIPTPRWTTFDAVRFGVPLPEVVPPTVQDRAYTSAVWYSPEAK